MASFKTIVAFLLVSAYGIEAGLLPPAGVPVAPAFAHAVAPAPISYARVAPYNIPPFAASVSTFAKSLALPAPLAPAGLVSPYAAPFLHGPVPAPGLVPAPAIAPAFNAAVGPAFGPGVGPAFGPAFNAAVGPAFGPAVGPAIAPGFGPAFNAAVGPAVAPGFGPAFNTAVAPAVAPAVGSAYAPAFAPGYPRPLFPSPYAAFPGSTLPLGAQFPYPVGRSVHAVAPVPAPLPAISPFGALPAAYPGPFPAPLL